MTEKQENRPEAANPKVATISINLDAGLLAKIDAAADEGWRNRSDEIRKRLTDSFAAEG